MDLLISQICVKKYHYCSSSRVALALNNPRRLIWLWTKHPKYFYFSTVILWFNSYSYSLYIYIYIYATSRLTHKNTKTHVDRQILDLGNLPDIWPLIWSPMLQNRIRTCVFMWNDDSGNAKGIAWVVCRKEEGLQAAWVSGILENDCKFLTPTERKRDPPEERLNAVLL